MGDETSAPGSVRPGVAGPGAAGPGTAGPRAAGPGTAGPGVSVLGGVLAASGAAAMGTMARWLSGLASTSQGHEILILWVLLGIAALGTLLCLYLALIWGLAASILLAGPASRLGIMLLGPLRVLAPRLARRVASGAAVATAATVLSLGPGIAAPTSLVADHSEDRAAISQSAELLSAEIPTQDPAPEGAAPGSNDQGPEGMPPAAPLPSLGWDGGPSPSAAGPTPGAPSTSAPSDAHADGTPMTSGPSADSDTPVPDGPELDDSDSAGPAQVRPSAARTVVVHQGDSLWSISDDLLGPGASDPAEIAALWPLLHETNRDLIGADPDRLHPGQELSVPTTTTTQDTP